MEETVPTPITELLQNSKRMPEILIVLKCKEEKTFARTIFNDQIEAEYNRIMEKRKAEATSKRAE